MIMSWLIGALGAGAAAAGCAGACRLAAPHRGRHLADAVATVVTLTPAPAKPWHPATLPELPAPWELALDARFANQLARHTPRGVPPMVAARCAAAAIHATILGAAAAAAAAELAADFDRWPHLAPIEWHTDIIPAVTA